MVNPALSVVGQTDEVETPAQPATNGSTERTPKFVLATMQESKPTTEQPQNELYGDTRVTKPSTNSEPLSSTSSTPWTPPRDALELAAQANVVATQLLNGEVPLITVRTYASLVRGIAGLLKAEQARQYIQGPEMLFHDERIKE